LGKTQPALTDWADAGHSDQLSWARWYAGTLPQEAWSDWPDISADRKHQQIRKEIFVNQGWRLTRTGLKVMCRLYHSWVGRNPDNRIMTGRILLGMDQALGAPWGIQDTSVVLFNPQLHFELQMCNGSAQEWLRFHLGH
jgi:hypothetical protein